jgi:Coenzyme PQQ synthesis protein D (PqqD)
MRLKLRTGVSASDTEYGSVLLDERSGEYWQLNPVGTLVVRQLQAGDSPVAIAAVLSVQFDVDTPQALEDVTALIDQLKSARLVTVTP